MPSEVERLKERLAQEIKNCKQAAEYGSQLLDDNRSLKLEIRDLKLSHTAVIENYCQQIHNLTSRLETKTTAEKDQDGELEAAREMCETLKLKLTKLDEDSKRRLVNFRNVEAELVEKTVAFDALNKRVEVLECELNEAKEKLQQSMVADSFTEPIEMKMLSNENSCLVEELNNLKHILEKMQETTFQLEQREGRLKASYTEVLEAVDDRDKEISGCHVQMKKAQEELEDLKAELVNMKLSQVDVKKRGNSLFAELEDNRKVLENEVKTLRSEKKVWQEKEEVLNKEIWKLKHKIILLSGMSNTQADANHMQKLLQSLSQARGEIAELSLRLQASEEKCKKLENGGSIKSPTEIRGGPKVDAYAFMNTLISEKDRKVQDLESQMEPLRRSNTSLKSKLIQGENQIYSQSKTINKFKIDMERLRLQVDAMRCKNQSSAAKVTKPAVRVEKIPGFNSERRTVTLVEATAISSPNDTTKHSSETFSPLKTEIANKENLSANKSNKSMLTNDTPVSSALESSVKDKKSSQNQKAVADNTKRLVTDSRENGNTLKPLKLSHNKTDAPCVLVSSKGEDIVNDCKQQ